MNSRASAWSSAVLVAATCVFNSGISYVLAQSQQAPPPGQQQPPAPPPQGQQPNQPPPGQQQPPPDQQTPQGQPPAQDPAAPPSVLLPPGPAVPILSGGIPAAVSTQPGRAFERPYRGVFGGSAVGPGQPGMFLTLGALAAYDDNLIGSLVGSDQPALQVGGYYEGGTAGLEYMRAGQKFTLTAGGSGEVRYYNRFDHTSTSMAAHAATTFQLGRRNVITGRQGFMRAELYRMAGLPGLEVLGSTPTADAEFNVNPRDRIMSDSFIGYTRELTSTSRLVADYSYRRAETAGLPLELEDPLAVPLDLRVNAAGIAYERQVSRYTQLNLGYRRNSAWYEAELTRRHVLINDLNIGGGYARPLSFSRRTMIRLSGGTGMITREALAGAPPVDYFRFTANASLEHEIGRTWSIVGSYTRGMQFVEGFADPFFLDAARLETTGLIRPRVELTARLMYTDGRLALTTQENPYTSLAAMVMVGYALSTEFELVADYGYRYYQFESRAGLPLTVSPDVGRNQFGVRLRYWLPIFTTR